MKREVDKLLKQRGPLKAREIANLLGKDKAKVSVFLRDYPNHYKQDASYRWSVASTEVVLYLPGPWLTAADFEQLLFEAYSGQASALLRLSFEKDCNLMFDCVARVLAVANQIASQGCGVVLDFSECGPLKNFLNRAGFFDHLAPDVVVLPKRPKHSTASARRGKSDALVELGTIKLDEDNQPLVRDLCHKFVALSDEAYLQAATTMFGELIDNVCVHSAAGRGFAGFQKYKGRRGRKPHIQTVVSDDGKGIATTLRSTLAKHHPELFKKYGTRSTQSDMDLVKHAVRNGEVSRFGKGRGLGLKSTREQTKRFDAELSVRQEGFSFTFRYRDGILVPIQQCTDVVPLRGTHVCFDFFLA